MTRMILALLALLTGLAGQIAPAQARAEAAHSAQVCAIPALPGAATRARAGWTCLADKAKPFAAVGPLRDTSGGAVPEPGVRIGVDRARE